MTRSSLCTYSNITSNHSNGRGGNGVCKITPHYMCAKWSGRQCADYFAQTARQASSNYCIGYDGDIAMSVDEDDRAWTSSSGWNDRQAITIECANNSDSSLPDATYQALVSLCADVCNRYGIEPSYDGTRNATFTEHRMFASTDCPGAWLHSHMSQLVADVKTAMGGGSVSAPASSGESAGGEEGAGFGGSYRVACDELNVRHAPGLSGAISGVLTEGDTVVLDDWYTEADGGTWGRYTGYSGRTLYVCVKFNGVALAEKGYTYSLPAGEYTFRYAMNVRSAPSTDADIVASYAAGQSVTIDATETRNGYVWGSYTGASSGLTRYVALATADGAEKYVY